MLDPRADQAAEIIPARKLAARVGGLYAALGGSFQTEPVEELTLGFDGIAGDFHAGARAARAAASHGIRAARKSATSASFPSWPPMN